MARPVGARTAKEVLCEGNPVRNLWMAVIIKSWRDLKLRKRLKAKIYNKQPLREDEQEKIYNMIRARFFFFSEQSNFLWICEQLSLDSYNYRMKAKKRLKENEIDYLSFRDICFKHKVCDLQKNNQCPDSQCFFYKKLEMDFKNER